VPAVSNYLPTERWTFSQLGYFVGGRSDRYDIHLLHPGGKVTRIVRDLAPVPITLAERQRILAAGTASGRSGNVRAQVAASDIPDVKPLFDVIRTDADARIWVQLRTPSERRVETLATGAGVAGATTREWYQEKNLYEVFAADGRYLGRVEFPDFTYPPAIKGNSVWSAGVDADGVPVVVKYQIVPPLPR
jgi:hypothetical protein